MDEILAIETATDACSVAVSAGERVVQRHEVAPRQHSQRLLRMLEDILPEGDLNGYGVSAIAYGCGPGSFTGLRIAASTAQGLAYACDLPAIAVPTLAVLAQTALAEKRVPHDAVVLCTLDARLDELYAAVYRYENGLAVLREGPWACPPADLPVRVALPLHVVGSGACYLEHYPSGMRRRIIDVAGEVLPRAGHMIPLARQLLKRGEIQRAEEICPIYVRDEITWKKLADQGGSR